MAQGARQCHALLFAAGQLSARPVGQVRQADA